jgi:RNA polymerase sigma-32 factor
MSKAININLPSLAGSLENYILSANQVPMLSFEKEQELANRLIKNNDLDAARELVMSHLKFVVKIARGYDGYGLALSDLIQEGNVGLMQAVKRFNPEKGVRLAAFAAYWIKSCMHEFILKNWRIVKIATTKAQRKLFFNLRSVKKSLGWLNSAEKSVIANDLGVANKDVEIMEQRLVASDLTFERAPSDSDDTQNSPEELIEDYTFEPSEINEKIQNKNLAQDGLKDALLKLDDRSRDIIVSRWLRDPKNTLVELADRYDVSAERIRQLEKSAFEEMKSHLPQIGDVISH